MRVISGSAKGRKLRGPFGASILRPTSDQVREAVFDIIGPCIEDSRFLDLFSGTGAVGIEALSRGARNATFIDNRSASIELIRANLSRCGFKENFEVISCDVSQAISSLCNRQRVFDYIFLDPPYNTDLVIRTLETICNCDLLLPSTTVLVEHTVKRPLPERVSMLSNQKEYTFGDTQVTLLRSVEV